MFHWLQDKPHVTYLISVVAGDFAVWKGHSGKVSLAGYVDRRHEALASRSFELTADMMAFFEARTGHPYPWDKYDQLCVHGFNFGGMENTSATTLTEGTLHDERVHREYGPSAESLIAHELAHQWFGDLLTCRDWPHGWLNEGFATYCEVLWKEHAEQVLVAAEVVLPEECVEVGREALVEPRVGPVAAGEEVSEPLVGQFV